MGQVTLRLYGYAPKSRFRSLSLPTSANAATLPARFGTPTATAEDRPPYTFRNGKPGDGVSPYWAEDPSLLEYAFTYSGSYVQKTMKLERRVWDDPAGKAPKDVGSEALELTFNDDCSAVSGQSIPHLTYALGEQAHSFRLTRGDPAPR